MDHVLCCDAIFQDHTFLHHPHYTLGPLLCIAGEIKFRFETLRVYRHSKNIPETKGSEAEPLLQVKTG